MASPSTSSMSLIVFFFIFTFGSCRSFHRSHQDNEFPVLHLSRRGSDGVDGNQTLPRLSDSFMCNFTHEYLLSAAKTNCSNYISPLEQSIALPPWDRSESIAGFANCTYHEIASRFADFPDGIPTLVFWGGTLFFTPKPNMVDARAYPPPPAIDSSLWNQLTDHPEAVPFLPILQNVTQPVFTAFLQAIPSYCTSTSALTNATNSTTNISTITNDDQKMKLEAGAQYILQLIEISTQQYTRCSVQTQPATEDSIKSCVESSVSKLNNPLPSAMYIYFGAPECDSRLWSFVGVALSILLEVLHLTMVMYINHRAGDHSHTSFSWLQFLIKLASGLGEPIVQAVLLLQANSLVHHTSSAGITYGNVGFVLAAMEFLQPTAAPLVAAISGWYFSKGFGFQVFATEAITTLLGVAMIVAFTFLQFYLPSFGPAGSGGVSMFLAIVGLLCAIGPWALLYVLLGVVALPLEAGMMLGMMIGMFECFLGGTDSSFGFKLFFACFWLLIAFVVIIVGFVGLTPIFGIWEAVWVGLKKYKKWKEARRLRKEEAMVVMGQAEPEQQQQQQQKLGYYQPHELHAQGSKEPLMVAGTKEVGPEQGKTEADMFPLARWFRRRFQKTSRIKRGFVKCLFWSFIALSLISFVGKWMFMVNILSLAGDVYCPNGYKEATWGGLGFKAAVLLIGVVLQFFGLTA